MDLEKTDAEYFSLRFSYSGHPYESIFAGPYHDICLRDQTIH